MKKITKALTIATFLTSISVTGILVDHQSNSTIALTTNHQVETNLKGPGLQKADPIYKLELTPFNNPEGINGAGLILLNLNIEQTTMKQVSEVNVRIDQESSTAWTKIYDGGFDDMELNLSYGFTELTNKIYTIDVIIKLTNSDSPEMVFNEKVEISANEQTTLVVNKDTMIINPTINEDGTITYLTGAIEVYLMAPQKTIDYSKVDASKAMFNIFYKNNATKAVQISYDQNTAKVTSTEEIIIPEPIVESGYLITLTGIIYDLVPVGAIEVVTIAGNIDETTNLWIIFGIVIGSIVGAVLLGVGVYWIIKD